MDYSAELIHCANEEDVNKIKQILEQDPEIDLKNVLDEK